MNTENDYWFVVPEIVDDEWGEPEEALFIKCQVEGRTIETIHFVDDCVYSDALENLFVQHTTLEFDKKDKLNTKTLCTTYGLSPDEAIDVTATLKFGIYGGFWEERIRKHKLLCFRD